MNVDRAEAGRFSERPWLKDGSVLKEAPSGGEQGRGLAAIALSIERMDVLPRSPRRSVDTGPKKKVGRPGSGGFGGPTQRQGVERKGGGE
jgi:hypothetical protein